MRSFKMPFRFLLIFSIAAASCKQQVPVPQKIKVTDSAVTVPEKNPYSNIDQSPLDMIYFPEAYPQLKMDRADSLPLMARVIYSRPHKKERQIFGPGSSLCPYGKPWRLGANEATEIEFFSNVSIQGKNVAKGSYILYCIPYADRWTIVLNNNLHTWGLHMDEKKDVLRADIPVMKQMPALEDFTMIFSKAAYGADLLMAWDDVKTILPIEFAAR
ncbi:MAG: DUF2911 domain-containing protein [Ferruginibacter sp.]